MIPAGGYWTANRLHRFILMETRAGVGPFVTTSLFFLLVG